MMSFNVWVGGSNVAQGPTKVRDAILQAGADIVAMQESNGLAAQLAAQLGWHSVQPAGSVAVLSRYPIVATLGVALHSAGVGVRVRLNASPPQDVIVWSAHLTPYPYGPYQACLDGASTTRILRDQRRTQLPEADDMLRLMAPQLADADNIPVFLLGDFNTPSHLDWTPATADLHCGYSIAWPVTVALQNAGLIDAYRERHPDPRQAPGNTWSPVYQTLVYPDGKPEPQDRIDMVHYAGAGVTVDSAERFVIGTPQQHPNHTQNQWPSDHAAVLVDVTLEPGGGGPPVPQPTLALDRTSYARGQAIVASFGNGPGNSKDWIGIYRSSDPPPVRATRPPPGTTPTTSRPPAAATAPPRGR